MNEILNSQTNNLGIKDFLNSAKVYTNTAFPDIDLTNLFENTITGNLGKVMGADYFSRIFLKEVKTSIILMISVLVIIIIHSIFKSIIDGLENSKTSQIVYFIQYLIIVTIIVSSFISMLDITKECISDIISFMRLLIPLMITLMLSTGTIITSTVIEPILLFLVNFIGIFINNFLIPILLVSITISIVSNISDKFQMDKMSKFLKSSIVWILGIILTIFSCTVSLEGNLSSSVDGLTAKSAKAAVSNFIPVVGKIMGDTVDSVIGCGNILKNSVGTIGVIIIIGIVLIPIIKVSVLWFSFRVTSAVCEVIADTKIIKLLDNIADGYKILVAILVSVSIMFIIGITIVIKITNSALMYR